MTSNLGAEHLANQPEGEDSQAVRPQVMAAVQNAFRPEFLNRLDELILFQRLTRSNMDQIVDIQMMRLQNLLTERKITIRLDEPARKWLGDQGYDPVFGARPLKRVIQKMLQDPLAELLLAGDILDGEQVEISAIDGGLTINGKPATGRSVHKFTAPTTNTPPAGALLN